MGITFEEENPEDLLTEFSATQEQLDYIDDLLDQSCMSLSDYTATKYEDLTKEEASEVIDRIKEDLGYD